MSRFFFSEHIPTIIGLFNLDDKEDPLVRGAYGILENGYEFSRMLHGSPSSSGGTVDAFYRAFVPEVGSVLYPSQIELVKRCLKSERQEQDRVGATVFPGLVKVTRGAPQPNGQPSPHVQTVVRRAQAVCECALGVSSGPQNGA